MENIWQFGGSPSVRDVMEKAYPNGEKAYTTVQTIINNLEAKGFLTHNKVRMVNFYKPTRKQEALVKEETTSLVSKVFKGSFMALANNFLHSDSLTPEDIEELKAVIEKRESKRDNQS